MNYFKNLFVQILLIIAFAVAADAQSKVRVSGVVTSADDGLPMMGVAVMAGPTEGVVTSLDGDYLIEVAPLQRSSKYGMQ